MPSFKFSQNRTPQPTPSVCIASPPPGPDLLIPHYFALNWTFAIFNEFCYTTKAQTTTLIQTAPDVSSWYNPLPRKPGVPQAILAIDMPGSEAHLEVIFEECFPGLTFPAQWNYLAQTNWPFAPSSRLAAGDLETGLITVYPFALKG